MEIVLPATKPAMEWLRGRALQKVSPQERHARAQSAIAAALESWAHDTGYGRVGIEWEFRIAPPSENRRPLVPDVAYLSYNRIGFDNDDDAQIPRAAPNVVFEILSPDDRRADVEHKIAVYLVSGTEAVFLVDTLVKTVTVHDHSRLRSFVEGDLLTHIALPEFTLPIARIFAKPVPRARR